MNIVQNRFKYLLFSLIIIAAGLVAIIINLIAGKGAFNYDIDFVGGTEIQMDIGQDFLNDDIARIVTETTGEQSPQIQRILGTNTVVIKIKEIDSIDELFNEINAKYSIEDNSEKSVVYFSPVVSNDMKTSSLLAVLFTCISMLVYISIRFREFKTGLTTVIALLHDVFIVIAFYAIFRIPINIVFIAAILTILAYSINANIVVFDRIRENKNIINQKTIDVIINTSITQTLRRSVYTSLTTLVTIVCLYVFGVPSIREFTLPIIIGISFGTYSSVFLLGSIYYMLVNNKKVS